MVLMTAMIMVMVMMVMVAGAGGGRCSQICPHQGKRYFSFVFFHHHHHHSHHHPPQLVIRGSVILNLFLLLYLSLYAGWTTSFASNTEKPFNREILNSYFEVNYCLCFETLYTCVTMLRTHCAGLPSTATPRDKRGGDFSKI